MRDVIDYVHAKEYTRRKRRSPKRSPKKESPKEVFYDNPLRSPGKVPVRKSSRLEEKTRLMIKTLKAYKSK